MYNKTSVAHLLLLSEYFKDSFHLTQNVNFPLFYTELPLLYIWIKSSSVISWVNEVHSVPDVPQKYECDNTLVMKKYFLWPILSIQ